MGVADKSHLVARPSPYLDLGFTIFNGTVFRIGFGRDIDGHVVCMDQKLEKLPQIEDPTAIVPQGQSITIRLRVWLTKEEAEFIAAGPPPDTWPAVWFGLEHVGIWIIALDAEDRELARGRLDLSWTTFNA
jgi:hypothetical protein